LQKVRFSATIKFKKHMNILVIGCGYLGREIISSFTKKGHFITVATKSTKKLKECKNAQKAVILNPKDETGLFQLVENNELIILSIVLEQPEDYEGDYLIIARNLKKIAPDISSAKTVIFTSNTTVYGDHKGKWVDEFSDLNPLTDEAQNLIEAEKILLSLTNLNWHVGIMRLAEIYGDNLEISQKIQNLHDNTYPGNGQNFTNMVHINDVLEGLSYLISHNLYGVYNIADDDHPSRKELYTMTCEKLNLTPIKWDTLHKGLCQGNRRVSNYKLKSTGFDFVYPKRVIS